MGTLTAIPKDPKGTQLLDSITQSVNTPSIIVTSPNGGENWSGVQSVTWSAADADGDALTFTILYSPDNGSRWYPVASNVQGSSFLVDTSTLPGGQGGKFRVIMSDGFNNAQDDTDAPFLIPDKPPVVSISNPLPGLRFTPGQPIVFQGDASTLDASSLPESAFSWSYTVWK